MYHDFAVAPGTRLAGDRAPGVRLMCEDDVLARLTPTEARNLGAELILCAGASEAQWDAPGPRAKDPEAAL